MTKAWSDEEAERRLLGKPSEEDQGRAERFFADLKSQNSISDEEGLEILQGRRPKKAVRESVLQGQSERPSRDPIVAAIEGINSQIVSVLEASRRQDLIREVIRAGRDGRSG